MEANKTVCKKVKFTKRGAIGYLTKLKEKDYGRKPWREEISYYKCEKCGAYHCSSIMGEDGYTLIENKTYFEHQKEKYRSFLQNYSKNKGRL